MEAQNLKPLVSLEDLTVNMEVYGIGWDGEFQKGIITDSLRHVKFNNEFGGCKVIGKKYYLDKVCIGNNGHEVNIDELNIKDLIRLFRFIVSSK